MKLEKIEDFLEELKLNNNKDWFHENKDKYLEAREIFTDLIDNILLSMALEDKRLSHIESKDCIFRLNRDLRFSADKTPYKTNFGAAICLRGRSGKFASYYIHLEKANSFVGGGLYMSGSKILKAIRTNIYEEPEQLLSIISEAKFVEDFGGLYGDKLKIAPKGFPKDFEHIGLLNHKHFMVIKNVPNNISFSNSMLDETLISFNNLKPLVEYINNIITEEEL